MSRLKPFKSIPGPKSYPVIGTLWNYLPIIGKYRFDRLDLNGIKKSEEFGPVVREEIVPGVNVIWIFKPEDIQLLFKREGRYPQRRSHLILNHYRCTRKDVYNTGGLLPTNGPEWWRLRSVFQKSLSSPRKIKFYLPVANEVVDDFIQIVAKTKEDLSKDFLPYLSRAFLELLGLVAFDRRLSSFSSEEMKPSSRCSRLIESALTANSCILKSDNGLPIWKYLETPIYRKFKKAHGYLESVAIDFMESKLKENKHNDEREESLLDIYLNNPDIDHKDVVGMSVDMLLAGIDTTTYSTSFVLYHLSKNKDKQEQLFQESIQVLPKKDSSVTCEVLNRCHYLKAVLKESFRLNPISVGIGRLLTEDCEFSGYHVPSGNVVVTQNQVVCRSKEYFNSPSEFVPERWLKNSERYENVSPYLVLPFGHGPRACIARRLAEQNMQTLILKICRNFEIDWIGENKHLHSKSYLINVPDGPIRLSFKERSH